MRPRLGFASAVFSLRATVLPDLNAVLVLLQERSAL